MPIKLWTGNTGASKTADMIASALKFKEANPDRPVFQYNIDSCDPSVATELTLEQLQNWKELPPGSLILIDECNEDGIFPPDRGFPEPWVKDLIKNRREGMDFWITTVHPSLMSPYVRRLVCEHVHRVRKFNTKIVQRFTWGRCMDNCEKDMAQKTAVSGVGTLPSHVYSLYKSANAHTMKPRVPLKVYLLGVAVVVGIAAAIFVPIVLKRAQHNNIAAISGGKKDGQTQTATLDQGLRVTDYAKWLEPRVAGLPWTAPAYDQQTVKSQPRLFCIAVDDGRTECITEQGTHVEVPVATARLIASQGVYNPFLPPLGSESVREAPAPDAGKPQALPPVQGLPDQMPEQSGRLNRKLSDPYTPPEYLAPNA